MRHLDDYKIFEGKIGNFFRDSKIKSICKKYNIENYTINKDGSIDVDGQVYLSGRVNLELPLKFNRVTGWFYCDHNNLTTLEGCPEYVGGGFACGFNNLTSLVGCPKRVDGYFDCGDNNITSLEVCPEYVRGSFNCSNNPIYSVVQYFIYARYDLIELFNYYDIVQDMNVIYDRLRFFYEGIDIRIADRNLQDIKRNGYKIIY